MFKSISLQVLTSLFFKQVFIVGSKSLQFDFRSYSKASSSSLILVWCGETRARIAGVRISCSMFLRVLALYFDMIQMNSTV